MFSRARSRHGQLSRTLDALSAPEVQVHDSSHARGSSLVIARESRITAGIASQGSIDVSARGLYPSREMACARVIVGKKRPLGARALDGNVLHHAACALTVVQKRTDDVGRVARFMVCDCEQKVRIRVCESGCEPRRGDVL